MNTCSILNVSHLVSEMTESSSFTEASPARMEALRGLPGGQEEGSAPLPQDPGSGRYPTGTSR